jgi:hypothetical protein
MFHAMLTYFLFLTFSNIRSSERQLSSVLAWKQIEGPY